MEKRKELWRALPFVMAMLLLTLVPMQSADALFGKGKEEAKAADGAPVAENLTIKVYRGVPYEGVFRAVDNEGDEMTFAIAQEPKKGMVALTEDGLGFVYTPGGKLGADSFTYTASDACGNTSLPATVSVTVEKASSGICYADMGGNRAHTAAVDLAEHGVFVGARIGDSYFFEPERTLSRGEFVAMALAAMDVSAEDVQMTGFCDDAGIPTWAKGYAVSALNAGVVSGVSTAEGVAFRANDAISLNEAAVAAARDGRRPLGLRRAGCGKCLVRAGGGEFAVRQRDRERTLFRRRDAIWCDTRAGGGDAQRGDDAQGRPRGKGRFALRHLRMREKREKSEQRRAVFGPLSFACIWEKAVVKYKLV